MNDKSNRQISKSRLDSRDNVFFSNVKSGKGPGRRSTVKQTPAMLSNKALSPAQNHKA
jgi:hypothetical protein